MTRRRMPPSPPPPQAPPVEPDPRPEWSLPEVVRLVAYTVSVRQAGERVYHLPPVQRGIVWTAEQQFALVRSMWLGLPVAPLVVWCQPVPGGVVRWLVDGQQRATAMGLDVRDARDVRRPVPPTRWDWRTGRWSLDEGEPMKLAELATFERVMPYMASTRDGRTTRLEFSSRSEGYARACGCMVHTMEVGFDAGDPARLVEVFRALASPGVPWSSDDLAALAGAGAWEVRRG